MARHINRLTSRTVATKREPGRYADGQGLYLIVDKDGAKRWVLRFTLGKMREMGLGAVLDIDLAAARERAAAARKLVSEGIDPIEERKRLAEPPPSGAPTLGAFAEEVITSLEPEWVGRETAKSWRRTFELYALPIAHKPVDAIDTADILLVLKPIWLKLSTTAGKVRERLGRVLDAGRAAGHIKPPWENPARWKGHLSHLLPALPKLQRGHHRAMHYRDVPAFMKRLAERRGVSARALEWTILTVARESMTLGASWQEEVDDIWTVPADRMKGRKYKRQEFRIPINVQAKAVLDRVRPPEYRPTDYIFPGQKEGKPLSDSAMDNLLDDMGEDCVPHGFRTSFRDWVEEQTSFGRDLAERCMAHVVGDETERSYLRGDVLEKRRKVMEAWGRYCAGEAAEVAPMERKA